jgi:hypothetical protein
VSLSLSHSRHLSIMSINGFGDLKMNNELRISILFSVIVVYNLFSSLKYTILLRICYLKVIDE